MGIFGSIGKALGGPVGKLPGMGAIGGAVGKVPGVAPVAGALGMPAPGAAKPMAPAAPGGAMGGAAGAAIGALGGALGGGMAKGTPFPGAPAQGPSMPIQNTGVAGGQMGQLAQGIGQAMPNLSAAPDLAKDLAAPKELTADEGTGMAAGAPTLAQGAPALAQGPQGLAQGPGAMRRPNSLTRGRAMRGGRR